MNTKKHKHKNRPKPQPGSVEVKDGEEKCDVVEKITEELTKPEGVLPEVLSLQVEIKKEEKIAETPKIESTTVSAEEKDEGPAKPKRNKNKKKKQEPEKEAEKIETPKKQTTEEIKVEETVNLEPGEAPLEAVTPSARKKKNKKKAQDKFETKPIEENKLPQKEEVKPVQKEEVLPSKEEPLDTEVTELFSSEPTQEGKGKKKNKKKKRNDSEKSEKSEDIKCTPAFEKLLVDDSKPKELDTKPTEIPVIENVTDGLTVQSVENTILEDIEELKTVEPAEMQKDGNKGKKKNKKDKKHTIEPQRPKVPSENIEIPIEFQDDSPIQETKIEKEHSPKPKAKIAKPVEKKRKDNTEVTQPSENISKSTENVDIIQESDTPFRDIEAQEEIKSEVEIKPSTDAEIHKSSPMFEESITEFEEKLKVPESSTMGKKRKKSPKPKPLKARQLPEDTKISPEISITQSQLELEIIKAAEVKLEPIRTEKEIKDIKPKETVKEKTLMQDIQKEKTPMKDIQKAKSPMKDIQKEKTPIKDIPKEKSPIKEDKTPIEMKINIDDDLPPLTPITEDKTTEGKGKKKKKTLKVPMQHDSTATEAEKATEPIEKSVRKEATEIKQSETKTSEDKPSTKIKEFDIESKQLLEDIEVRSVKTDESEGSACDVTPDVHFVRSSSQQILDSNNNNMVIQEIMSPEDVRPNEPIAMPWVRDSGKTPTLTPEKIPLSFDTKKDLPKENVKSKMMEVNKDMEELRLSIERSLAEFSAIEKTEKEVEKKVEEQPITKPLAELKQEFKITKHKSKTPEPKPILFEQKPMISEIKTSSEVQNLPPKEEMKQIEELPEAKPDTPPCPARKDKKGKLKNKKGKPEAITTLATTSSTQSSETPAKTTEGPTEKTKEEKQEKGDCKSQSTDKKGKQQSNSIDTNEDNQISDPKECNESNLIRKDNVLTDSLEPSDYDPIDNFEDALTSSNDDVNKTFEIIAQDAETETLKIQKELSANKPEISITAAEEDSKRPDKSEKVSPISPPKNLLGHTDIPVPSNRTDYKKEKNKPPNERQARVKIKDATDIEKKSTECQTESKKKNIEKSVKDTFSHVVKDSDDYVYKYSFRKVFLQSACHICKKDLGQTRVPCGYCNLVFYCGSKHKDEDYPQHQALCFAVSTIVHLKDQKHIYADARGISGQDYRILRMQMILSCEKVLKRRLVPWEQEAMLYPRICADVACREWRQGKLKNCEGCGQLSYCSSEPSHLPQTHQRWCKSYSLYAKLVTYQQTKGRLEPRLPRKVFTKYEIPGKMNEVLAAMYEEKIDMTDIQYAALTQLATAPFTAAYYHQVYRDKNVQKANTNGTYKKPFTIHVVGAELQFEADALNKWEMFFLHLRPDVDDMTVVLVSPALNPGNLPLELLGKVRMCAECKVRDRRVTFSFQDKTYFEYRTSDSFINPDLICAFNPSIQRGSTCNLHQEWSSTLTSILKLKQPLIITAYTLPELRKDIAKIKELTDLNFSIITEPIFNNFASVRPDRNFITDDEIPLLFKNYCVSVICGC